ncbi:MAG: alpha/beta fold hydrolase [Candidatus Krumholzibacteria bacterium]|nr:alpha/beta fold hydrolase [Candidatus Krumholzibacteria bacterium]
MNHDSIDLAPHHLPFSHKTEHSVGILVSHGLTSTTSSMRPLAESFADAGFHVELPCLRGHGTQWQDLNRVTYQDWLEDMEVALAALQVRCEKVFVCGLSLGGALVLHLAHDHPEIAGVVLINHVAVFTNPKFWFVPLIHRMIPSTPAVGSDIKKPDTLEMAYPRTPSTAVNEMLKLMKVNRKRMPDTWQPTLIFKSLEDHVVPVKSAEWTMKHLGSKEKELVLLTNSYHVAPLDHDQKIIEERSLEFFRSRGE